MQDPSIFSESSLCVVGAICRDVKTAPFPAGDYLLKDGETAIPGLSETIGGGGANSAAMASKLGAKAHFAGLVGNDALGERLRKALERAGVVCFLPGLPGLLTGTTLNLVYSNGHRHFLSCHPNNAALNFDQIDRSALAGCRHLLRADVWFSEAMLFGGNDRLFQEARRLQVATSIDLNWDPQWGHASDLEIARRKAAVRGVLPLVDLAHGNVRELCAFADAPDLESALQRITNWGAGAVVVHQGAEGAGYFAKRELVTSPPVPINSRVMATGTGDVLSACMMLLHHRTDLPVLEKLQLANTIVAEFMEGRRHLIPEL